MAFDYKPGPTGERFLASRAKVKIIMGPIGGGKSTVALMDALRRVITQNPYKKDGKGAGTRYSKVMLLRNTLPQLKSTVKPLIDSWFSEMPSTPMGEWQISEGTYKMRMRLKDGTSVWADWIFMPADTPEDIKRLLSVEVSFAWGEECREIDPEIFSGAQSRTARWPSKAMGGVTYPGIIGSTNAPPQDTFWHGVITDPPKGWEVFIQPPAMLDNGELNRGQDPTVPCAENLEHLPDNYYEDLVAGKTVEWINVYLKNKFGSGGHGLPVWRDSFRKAWHVSPTELQPIVQTLNPIIIGLDNGLQAAAVVGQMDARGRVNILDDAYVPADQTMGVEKFFDTILIPKLLARYPHFKRSNMIMVMDPACFERSQVDEKTIDMAARARGFQTKRAITNDPERRIGAVEGLLTRAIDGGPAMLFSPAAIHVAKAVEFGYKYKVQKDPEAPKEPDKKHYSHVADALQYLALHYNIMVDPILAGMRSKARVIQPAPYVY
jgi:hypothetical protein